jgi:hypothetical protein
MCHLHSYLFGRPDRNRAREYPLIAELLHKLLNQAQIQAIYTRTQDT